MDTFVRAKRDPASGAQTVSLLVLFGSLFVIVVLLVFPDLLPFGFRTASHAPLVARTHSPSLSSVDPRSLFVVGLLGCVLAVAVIANARHVAKGRNVLLIEVGKETIIWGFGDRLRSVSTSEFEEVDLDDSFGLQLSLITAKKNRIQLPNLGYVIPPKDRKELISYLSRVLPELRLTGSLIESTEQAQTQRRPSADPFNLNAA